MILPPGFVLGAATSAYQIEGGWNVDGKGPSIWDTYTSVPGRTAGSVSGRDGVDHYRRFTEDVRHMQAIGLDSYRFSLGWPRLLPEGTGRVNQAGADFYDRLIDTLLTAGIQPNVTLYHWDLPQALQDRGGWPLLRTEYGLTVPIYITENGYAGDEETPVDGRVHDTDRIAYLTGFLAEALRAATNGLDVRGYYVWSLLDNYEWAAAYTARFGLIRVDTADMGRVWKDSAYWFQRLCATRTLGQHR